MKKILAILLSATLLVMLLAACKTSPSPSGSTNPSTTPSANASTDPSTDPSDDPSEEPEEIDISEHVDLRWLWIANKEQDDRPLVFSKINEIIEEEINATISYDLLMMSDYATNYSLRLASGEVFDVISTGSWLFYQQEAPKGAFHEITMELVEKYMPRTWANQPHEHFDINRIDDGKVYMIPASFINVTGNARVIAYREDLRIEMGVPEITDLASLEVFFDAIKENQPGMFPYATAANNDNLKTFLHSMANNLIPAAAAKPINELFHFKYTPGITAAQAIDSLMFIGDSAEYREYALLMKEWADKGYWSRSAIADTTTVRENYENSVSASIVENTGSAGQANNALRAKGIEPTMVDIFPDAIRYRGAPLDGLAVPYTSQNLERALMFIDMVKYDERINELLRFGIEGVHWTWDDEEQRTWNHGPDQQRYTHGDGSWGFSSPEFEPRHSVNADPQSYKIFNDWLNNDAVSVINPIAAFSFQTGNVQTEIGNITNVISQHMYLIDLGLAGDVDAAIAAMNADLKTAGLDVVKDELDRQLAAWLAKQ